jgi:sec-independent protein translocase protein TatC
MAEAPLTLTEHLEELRRRLAWCLGVLLGAVVLSCTQLDRLMDWLQRPAQPWLPRLAFFTPTEPVTAYVKVALLSGVLLAMPYLLWQAWAFVRAGLTAPERRYGAGFVWWGSLQFALGAAFAWGVMLPVSLRVLLQLGAGRFEPVISLGAYLTFVTTMIFWTGIIFELPVLLWALAKVGIVTPAWLRQQRPYALLVLVIVAALMTPTTDIVSLLLMAIPLAGLYELSIVVTQWAMPSTQTGGEV